MEAKKKAPPPGQTGGRAAQDRTTRFSSSVQNNLRGVNTLEAALVYVRLGWSLIPLAPGSKSPQWDLLPKDKKGHSTWKPLADRAASEAEIYAWFEKVPDLNIGVLLGPSGLAVLDADDPQKVKDYNLWLPDTARVKTGRGFHYYYRTEHPAKTVAFDGGELRGNGSYVVLPPSVHGETGTRYEWLDLLDPVRTPPEGLKAVLVDQVSKLPKVPKKKREQSSKKSSGEQKDTQKSGTTPIYLGIVPRIEDTEKQEWGRNRLADWLRDDTVALRVVRLCGANVKRVGTSFHCILPGHTDSLEKGGSASLFRTHDGYIIYRDWHYEDGHDYYTLADVYRSWKTGKAQKFPKGKEKGLHTLWLLRALVEARVIHLPKFAHAPKIPKDAPDTAKAVYRTFLEVLGLSATFDRTHTSTPFAYHPMAEYAGFSWRKIKSGLDWLVDQRYIVKMEVIREPKTLTLYGIGPGPPS